MSTAAGFTTGQARSPIYSRFASAAPNSFLQTDSAPPDSSSSSTTAGPDRRATLTVTPADDPFARSNFEGPPLQINKGKTSREKSSVARSSSSPVVKSSSDPSSRLLSVDVASSNGGSSGEEGGEKRMSERGEEEASVKRKTSLLATIFPRDAMGRPDSMISVNGQEPPTASLKALNTLGVPSKSAKAISTLTGIKIEQRAGGPTYVPNDGESRNLRNSIAHSVATTARTTKTSTTTAGHLAEDEEDEDDNNTIHSARPMSNATSFSSHIRPAPIGRVLHPSNASSSVPPVPPLPSSATSSTFPAGVRKPKPPPKTHSRFESITLTNSKSSSTLGALYMVAGLSKDPSHWQLAQSEPGSTPAHSTGAVQRFWRPEVLGTTVAGDEASSMGDLDGRLPQKGKSLRGLANSSGSMTSNRVLGKEEVARIQSKAMKLSFTRDVEVIASTGAFACRLLSASDGEAKMVFTVAPPSVTHAFSFTIPSTNEPDATSGGTGAAAAWDLAISSSARPSMSTSETTYYAATLLIYSHADKLRTQAIRESIEHGAKGQSAAVARAIKAAASGRRFGKKLETRLNSPLGLINGMPASGRPMSAAGNETDVETEAFLTESEWEGPGAEGARATTSMPSGMPLWLPYGLLLVSRWPLFDLMMDILRISWARFHLDISQHSLAMSRFINAPAPRPGSILKVPAGAEGSTMFASVMPGLANLKDGAFVDTNVAMWPLFRALSADNLLTVCEIALSPLGRVVFFSQYPVMLSIAVETFKTILEHRGWSGISHAAVHSRDVRILLEDPGPFMLALHNSQRPLASDIGPEVLVVDLDTDRIEIKNPHPHALSKGGMRLRMRKKLEEAIGNVTYHSVPQELTEAFCAGRFRPFSSVEVNGRPAPAERLTPSWPFDQNRVLQVFEALLSSKPATGLRKLFFRSTTARKPIRLDSSTLHVQSIVRSHSKHFVDRRDLLEARIGKLNRRLGYLMTESSEWKTHLDTFRAFTNRLSTESQDLKNRLEKERKEARRLSGQLNEQETRKEQLSKQLKETEKARKAAESELVRMETMRRELQIQRDNVVAEVAGLASADEASLLLSDVFTTLDNQSQVSNIRRPGTSLSEEAPVRSDASPASPYLRARRISSMSATTARGEHTRAASLAPTVVTELGDGQDFELGDLERAGLQRAAVIETMRSIQARLQRALLSAGVIETPVSPLGIGGEGSDSGSPRVRITDAPQPTSPTLTTSTSTRGSSPTNQRIADPGVRMSALGNHSPVTDKRPSTSTSSINDTEDDFVSAASADEESGADDSEAEEVLATKAKAGLRPFLLPAREGTPKAKKASRPSSVTSANGTVGRPKKSTKRGQ